MALSDDLENATDIVDLVQKYSKLKKAGVNYKAVCPFPGHNEKTPSFVVSPAKQLAYCFGCHKGGGPLKFIMDIENTEFREALQILGNITGIQVNNVNPEKYKQEKTLFGVYKDSMLFYKTSLGNHPEILKYLMDRGLTEEIIDTYNFGYSPSGVELYNYLKNQGYEDQIIEQSAIFNSVPQKKDKFIGRIIIPIQNARGDYVAFAGRIFGKGEPKYLNSPATSIYDKSGILYGLFLSRTHITEKDSVIITEGYMDAISLYSAGFKHCVAVSGTALTEKHITILKRLTHKIYLCFDGDRAGEKATKLSIDNLKNNDIEVKIISLPEGSDPDDFIKSGGDFQKCIDTALSPIGYLIKKSDINLDSLDEKKKFLQEILSVLKSYESIVEKDFYLKEIAKKLDLREDTVYESFNKTRLKRTLGAHSTVKKVEYSSEDYTIAYLLNHSEHFDELKNAIIFPEYTSGFLQKILSKGPGIIADLDIDTKNRLQALAMKLDEQESTQTNEVIGNIFEKYVRKLNIDSYKKANSLLKEKMQTGDMDAFQKKSDLTKIALQYNIK